MIDVMTFQTRTSSFSFANRSHLSKNSTSPRAMYNVILWKFWRLIKSKLFSVSKEWQEEEEEEDEGVDKTSFLARIYMGNVLISARTRLTKYAARKFCLASPPLVLRPPIALLQLLAAAISHTRKSWRYTAVQWRMRSQKWEYYKGRDSAHDAYDSKLTGELFFSFSKWNKVVTQKFYFIKCEKNIGKFWKQ